MAKTVTTIHKELREVCLSDPDTRLGDILLALEIIKASVVVGALNGIVEVKPLAEAQAPDTQESKVQTKNKKAKKK